MNSMKKDYSSRLVDWCRKIIIHMDWDLEKETKEWEAKGSRSITIDEKIRFATYKAIEEAENYYGRGISTLYDMIPEPASYGVGWVNFLGYKRISDFTDVEINKQLVLARYIKDLVELYEDWKNNEFKDILKNIAKQNSFTDPEFTMHPSVLEAVHKLVLGHRFKVTLYQGGEDRITTNDIFHFGDTLGFSSDLNMWLRHIKKQQDYVSTTGAGDVFVTLFGKLDDVHPVYSNWLFTLQKGNTTWLVSDAINFNNPYQKSARLSRASVWRERESLEESCDLPYHLFTDIDAIRAASTVLAKEDYLKRISVDWKYDGFSSEFEKIKNTIKQGLEEILVGANMAYDIISVPNVGNSSFPRVQSAVAKKAGRVVAYWDKDIKQVILYDRPEVFFKNFAELPDGNKAFCLLLINEMIQYMAAENLKIPKVMLSSDYINIKLIEGATLDPTQAETSMSYWSQDAKIIFEELAETLQGLIEVDEKPITALSKHSYEAVVRSKHYDASWLGTIESLQSLSDWTILEAEAKKT